MSLHRPRPERDLTVGDRIRVAMATAGIVQEQLADVLGISQSNLSSKLVGRVNWYAYELADIAAALGMQVTDLVPVSTVDPIVAKFPQREWLVDPTVGQRMPLVGNQEIASTVDVSKAVVSNWINRDAMHFPRAVATMGQGPVFWWPQVYRWLTDRDRATVLKGMKGRVRPADEQVPWRPVPNPMPRLMGVADIARERGVDTSTVINWRRRGSAPFPPPVAVLSMGEIYLATELLHLQIEHLEKRIQAVLGDVGTSGVGSPVQVIDE